MLCFHYAFIHQQSLKKAIQERIQFIFTHKLVSKGKGRKDLFVSVTDKIVGYSKDDKNPYKRR